MLQLLCIYLLKTIIISGLLFSYYWFALRNKRFHYYNRFYLLAAVVLSLVLPLINEPIFTLSSQNDNAITLFNVMHSGEGEEMVPVTNTPTFDVEKLTLMLIAIITMAFLIRLLYRIVVIYRIKQKFPVTPMADFDFIATNISQAPFSFLRNVFWRNDISLNEQTGRLILQHEIAHIQQKHTLDKLFMQIVNALCWLNPVYILIQKELYIIHEFIADDKSVTDKDTAAFAAMLLQVHYGDFKFFPAQPFFYSPVKRRLIMLTTSKEPRFSYLRRIMALPLIACTVLLFAFKLQKEEVTPLTIAPNTSFKLVIDAGHGGTDDGANALAGNVKEKDITLLIAKKIQSLSASYGIDVLLTRDRDITLNPAERVQKIADMHADACVSIHINAAPDAKPSGMEVCIAKDNKNGQLDKSKILGSALIQKLSSNFTVQPALLQKQVGIWILQANSIPAALIECGYLSNKDDLSALQKEEIIERIANNILASVVSYAKRRNDNNGASMMYDNVKLQSVNVNAANKKVDMVFLNGDTKTITLDEAIDKNIVGETYHVEKDTLIPTNADKKVIEAKGAEGNKILSTVLYVINGVLKNKADMEKLDPNTIKSIDVLKGENATLVYGEKGKNGVIIITTKDAITTTENSKAGEETTPVYVLDGNFISAEEMKLIKPEDILSVNVLKGASAAKAYGKAGKNGVVEITTKEKKQPAADGKSSKATFKNINGGFPVIALYNAKRVC